MPRLRHATRRAKGAALKAVTVTTPGKATVQNPVSTDLQQRLAEVAGIRRAPGIHNRRACAPAHRAVGDRVPLWGTRRRASTTTSGSRCPSAIKQCCTVTTREFINGRSILMDLKFADYATLEEFLAATMPGSSARRPIPGGVGCLPEARDLDALIACGRAGVRRTARSTPSW